MKNKKFIILAFSLVVVMLGFGMVIPIFPFYIEQLGAGGTELGFLIAVSSLLEFLFGPFWGGVSDRIGRKPVLSIGMVGYALSTFLFGISTQLWMLFASRALSGLLSSAVATTAMAYVSDTTAEDERGAGMGQLSAAMALGMIIGPGIGGLLAGDSFSRPFFIACGMALFSLFLILIFLPESLPREERRQAEKQQKLRLAEITKAARGPLGFLFLLVMLYSFALANFEAVFGLYALEKYGYGPQQVGSILTVVALVSMLGKAILTGPVTKKWGDERVIKGSLLAGALGYLVLLWAGTFPAVLVATAFFILSKTLLRPASFALISKRSSRGQGMVMGITNSFMSLGRIIGPIWAGFAFDISVNLPYLSGSLFMFLGFIISLPAIRSISKESV